MREVFKEPLSLYTGVAQLVEYWSPKPLVVGSNPTARAKDIIVAGIKEYIQETYHELADKVTWPTWRELQSNTIVVVVASVIFSVIILIMDKMFGVAELSWWKGVLGFVYNLF